ncbi:hypothetical protein BmR1_04g09756 [Babesia microti strain RI]|uniref:Uncharacterized protein n=1 Tax=Babesia microti (strain RI) TaxID=1133968 RepID=A0A1N6LYG7_BABMR|nr:hypothetical protein BmR1_04g09756 [Babesia microti strain RI]SIO73919.1 hypothetical protein BmR1_04g09756 [Babesia microti strain RI]|eukprot:XP_021337968.1 hypothetical protein BmR1_04g09756 [Babesia microti strain RI]
MLYSMLYSVGVTIQMAPIYHLSISTLFFISYQKYAGQQYNYLISCNKIRKIIIKFII